MQQLVSDLVNQLCVRRQKDKIFFFKLWDSFTLS